MSAAYTLAREIRDEKKKEERMARLEDIETEVLEHASGIVTALLAFAEVHPQQQEPPEEWVRRYGQAGAEQRLRVAKSGWMPASLAPSGGKLAQQVMIGILRGRGMRQNRMAVRNLNVKIQLPAPTSQEHPGPELYPSKDIE